MNTEDWATQATEILINSDNAPRGADEKTIWQTLAYADIAERSGYPLDSAVILGLFEEYEREAEDAFEGYWDSPETYAEESAHDAYSDELTSLGFLERYINWADLWTCEWRHDYTTQDSPLRGGNLAEHLTTYPTQNMLS